VAHRLGIVVAGALLAGLLGSCASATGSGTTHAGAAGTDPGTTAAPPTDTATISAVAVPTVPGPTVAVPTTPTVPPTTAPAPTVAVARPIVQGTPRVLLVGDGILWDATPALQTALDAKGFQSRFESYFGFGLTKADFRDWPDLWPQYVAEEQPDVVVVQSGPNDALPRPGGPGGALIGPGDPGWAEWYGGLLDQAAAILTAGGAHVLWLGMLWPGQPEARPAMLELNRAMQALAARNPNVTYVDAPAGVGAPDGQYAEFAGTARLRKPDGEHLCAEGAARFALVVVGAIDHQLELPDDPAFATAAWRSADWRTNGRYDMDGGEHCMG
jgi:hypothetical protein